MKRLIVLLGLIVMLAGCGNKLNEFEYADEIVQGKAENIELCNYALASKQGYCKVLKDESVVYFDSVFVNEAVITVANSKNQDVTLPIEKNICRYAKQKNYESSKELIADFVTQLTEHLAGEMRVIGLSGDAIYVIQDMNGDLILRSTNGDIEYNYFDSKDFDDNYAEKMYNDCIAIGL